MFIVGFLVMAGISLVLFIIVYVVVRNYIFKMSKGHDDLRRAALRELEARAEEIDEKDTEIDNMYEEMKELEYYKEQYDKMKSET